MYASDDSDRVAENGWGTDNSWAIRDGFTQGPTTAAGFEALRQNQIGYVKQGLLWKYMPNERLLMCPADRVDARFYQRQILVCSYVWNGAPAAYSSPKGAKLSQFKPDRVLQWEADERTPFYFNDVNSYPDEGVSDRHAKGATMGLFGGSTERIKRTTWYDPKGQFAGPEGGSRGGDFTIPLPLGGNRAWCNPYSGNGLP
jgi:hypothetical protein